MYALGTMKESSAFRNLCRAYNIPMDEYNEVGKNLDSYRNDKKWKPIIDEAQKYIGTIESISPSPCSFVLSNKPLSKELSLIRVGNELCACIDGYTSDVWKYLKNDYLTVTIWKIISNFYKLINEPIPNIRELLQKVDDETWNLYEDGITATLNQADTDISTSMLKRYKPKSDAEMSAFVAAIRPGFASLVNTFLDRKPYSTGVKEIDDLLQPSYHFMLYQESIMAFLVWCGMEEDHTYDIIKKISKKKFTPEAKEKLRLELLEGYQKNLGTQEGFNEVWQVVDDATRYSFNAAHAVSVAYDSIYGAEAKEHHPLEYYTVVLNKYQSDNEKTSRIISELDYFDIHIENIKFGKSKNEYTFDRDTNTIYKSISSIKYCNEIMANELYELAQNNSYDNFIDLLVDIKSKTSVNARQLQILTILNFFSDFGNNKKLLQIIDLFERLYGRKQIKKSDYKALNINMDLFDGCYETETPKMYKGLHMDIYIKRVSDAIENTSLSIKEQIKYEQEYLEYIIYTNPKAPKNMFYVVECKFYKDKTKPYLVLYNLRTGDTLKTKITSGKKFVEKPFLQGNVLNVLEFKEKNKMNMIAGTWTKTSEKEKIVTEWDVY